MELSPVEAYLSGKCTKTLPGSLYLVQIRTETMMTNFKEELCFRNKDMKRRWREDTPKITCRQKIVRSS